ncbi:hypothetical protein PIB30_019886 [Stylosanthes scabra]|uniref:Uncharacterized protein n=1 Tax=Stylosanthes scabra TaxID=79078 RepID=A0ABU6T888_9FABA|nr:hypothetical protein [Stylosanthes scabra]
MKRRENSKKKTKGILRAHACTKALKRRALAQKGRQGNEKIQKKKSSEERTLATLEQQSCRKTKMNASAMQLKEEVRVMKTKWECGNRLKNIKIAPLQAQKDLSDDYTDIHSSMDWQDERQAEFGAEVAGESEKNERIATKPRRPLLDQMRTHQRSNVYVSRRGRHTQKAVSAQMHTH